MSKKKEIKKKLTPEEEEQLIEFVKNNEVLYNAKHKKYREQEMKNRV